MSPLMTLRKCPKSRQLRLVFAWIYSVTMSRCGMQVSQCGAEPAFASALASATRVVNAAVKSVTAHVNKVAHI
jgi:hypothetical protein